MKKKELEKLQKRVADLERELSELKSQLLSLALSRQQTILITPTQVPVTTPPQNPWYPPYYPIITCGQTVECPNDSHAIFMQ